MKFFHNLILIIIVTNIKSQPKVNVSFTQIENANFKITLKCVQNENCSSLVGTAILPYTYGDNKTSQIRLNHISLAKNETIERNIYIPVHNIQLIFKSSFKIGNNNVNYEIENKSLTVIMPKIIITTILPINNIQGRALNISLNCSTCNESIFIPEGTEIPDDTFYLSNNENKTSYLRSCTSMSELKSNNISINIICIPFSPGNVTYNKFFNSTNKIGFINIEISSLYTTFNEYKNSLYTECESLLSGSPIHYNVNKEKNPTFTLTSQKKIEENTNIVLLANDTYIYNFTNSNEGGTISVCTKNDDYTLECGIDLVHFPHLKQDDNDVSVYYIYEEKSCGKAFTGAVVLASNSFYIKNLNWYFLLFCFLF